MSLIRDGLRLDRSCWEVPVFAAATLPDPATLPIGAEMVVDGNIAKSDGESIKPALLRDNSSIIVFGTSIENFTTSSDGTRYPANGGVRIANSLMGWPWKNIYDFGVDGSKSPDFVARLSQTYSINAGWVWVGFPINDVVFDDVALADTLVNMQIVYDHFLLTGAKLILNLGQPIAAFSTDTSGAKKSRYFTIRDFVIDYVDTHDNCYIVDTAFSFTNPTMNSGVNLSAVTSDGIHDNYVGAFKKATAIKNSLQYVIRQNPVRDSAPQNYYQHCTNPLGIGDNTAGNNCFAAGAGITGTGPNQWQVRAVGTGAAVGSRSSSELPSDWPVTYSPQWVVTTTALNDGVDIAFGGEQSNAMSLNWVWSASAGMGLGVRRIPITANGYYYTAIVSGTTSATEPAWPTVEGATVVDGGVKWLCRKLPSAGEKWLSLIHI